MWTRIMLNDDAWFEWMNVNYRGKCTAKKIFFTIFFWFRGQYAIAMKPFTFFLVGFEDAWKPAHFLPIFYGNRRKWCREKKIQPAWFFFSYLCIWNEGLMLWLSQALFSRSHLSVVCIWRVYAKTSSSLAFYSIYIIVSLTYIHHIRYTR